MGDGIIIGVLVIVVFIGIRSSVKHFTGQGGCCGGGNYKPKKKKLSKVIYKKTFKVPSFAFAKANLAVGLPLAGNGKISYRHFSTIAVR